jgi:hypothetical protein
VTTVAEVDRLVQSDDAVAARLWPRLGPKVRDGYLHDRDAWIAVRREVDAGKKPSAETLAAHRKAFTGWARAFHAAPRPNTLPPAARSAAAAAAVAPAASPQPPPALAAATVAPAVAMIKRSPVGAGGAVAGGLILAGLIAVAARRKRS